MLPRSAVKGLPNISTVSSWKRPAGSPRARAEVCEAFTLRWDQHAYFSHHFSVLALAIVNVADSVTSSIKEQLHELQDEPFVFFCKHADTYVINKAILYVRCDLKRFHRPMPVC